MIKYFAALVMIFTFDSQAQFFQDGDLYFNYTTAEDLEKCKIGEPTFYVNQLTCEQEKGQPCLQFDTSMNCEYVDVVNNVITLNPAKKAAYDLKVAQFKAARIAKEIQIEQARVRIKNKSFKGSTIKALQTEMQDFANDIKLINGLEE